MKLLGIVILYNPDKEQVKQNILSYISQLDRLIIWENTPVPTLYLKFEKEIESKIVRMGYGRNTGIGIPLNSAVRFGQENNFTHLLTMDQDSCFGENMFADFLHSIVEEKEDKIASFSANTHPYDNLQPIQEEKDISITSGTVYKLEIFKDVGYFREDLFIDAIDTEYCFRLRKKGWKIIQFNKVYMHHILGNTTVTPFLWGKLISPNYPAQRTYYLIRNSLLVKRLYPGYKLFPGMFKTILFWRTISIIFVETDKLRKLKAMLLGIWHAARKKTGEYTIY